MGGQPDNIAELIRDMVVEFISQPHCIILAVSPGNQDIANSDGLRLARSIDPEGVRTLGVVTKIDLLDAGTSALEVLSNRAVPLKLGYVGVVNRSQADINGRPLCGWFFFIRFLSLGLLGNPFVKLSVVVVVLGLGGGNRPRRLLLTAAFDAIIINAPPAPLPPPLP